MSSVFDDDHDSNNSTLELPPVVDREKERRTRFCSHSILLFVSFEDGKIQKLTYLQVKEWIMGKIQVWNLNFSVDLEPICFDR